ncbi:hypothetical protein FVEN_g10124 [Fusarium venenatum]|uniref:Prion-inhibition and propagation HeLo domain-containing protein n=1 Tax=Fusarium venenatum TaxID=56646 RepID=A0A2L2TM65_9HYPO|nr:uncharacterized protein FVRRES_03193 [Fusarium venenatum]KAG8351730.1 hypothetical protein FVEN_g10124 [Fusarium venenatum]KAH7003762.1 hypothetical protein EDB82DRAFT_485032 [Fusarium venenatum]CEI66681.1 unnamed protein product [Fusarium venenatum]
MARDTDSPDIFTSFSKCIVYLDILVRETKHPAYNLKDSPPEQDIRDIRQDLNQWGVAYGANRSISSTLSLDYKFQKYDYTRSTILSQLGHLVEDLEGLQKLYKGESYQGQLRVIFGRVESVVNELIRFLGHLPKELWLELDRRGEMSM